jgi:ribosome-associated protein
MTKELEQPEQEGPSKSQIKRELHALQDLGERLAGLKPEAWEAFALSQSLLDALEESRRIKGHNAKRRHVRRLGKLLREEHTDRVAELFRLFDQEQLKETRRLHLLERWRERLLDEGDETLQELLTLCPDADRQRLRQLIRSGRKEREAQKPPAAQRKLFRYLRDLGLG